MNFPICSVTAQSLLVSNFAELAQVAGALKDIVAKVPHAFKHSLENVIHQVCLVFCIVTAHLTFHKISATSHQYEQSKESSVVEAEEKHTTFAEEFVKQYDAVVHHLLISFQSLRGRIQAVPRTNRDKPEDAENEEPEESNK